MTRTLKTELRSTCNPKYLDTKIRCTYTIKGYCFCLSLSLANICWWSTHLPDLQRWYIVSLVKLVKPSQEQTHHVNIDLRSCLIIWYKQFSFSQTGWAVVVHIEDEWLITDDVDNNLWWFKCWSNSILPCLIWSFDDFLICLSQLRKIKKLKNACLCLYQSSLPITAVIIYYLLLIHYNPVWFQRIKQLWRYLYTRGFQTFHACPTIS